MGTKSSEIEWKKQDHVRLMTLNRPEKMNALTPDGEAELSQRLIEFRDDEEAWVLVITGSGRAFSTAHHSQLVMIFLVQGKITAHGDAHSSFHVPFYGLGVIHSQNHFRGDALGL